MVNFDTTLPKAPQTEQSVGALYSDRRSLSSSHPLKMQIKNTIGIETERHVKNFIYNIPFSLLLWNSLASCPCRASPPRLARDRRHQTASWSTRLCARPAGGCERGTATGVEEEVEEEGGGGFDGGGGGCRLQVEVVAVAAGGPLGPAAPGSGLPGSYSWVAAGCCS